MTADAKLVLQVLFVDIWHLFTSWTIPGTNTTPAEWAIFSILFLFTIKAVKYLAKYDHGGN